MFLHTVRAIRHKGGISIIALHHECKYLYLFYSQPVHSKIPSKADFPKSYECASLTITQGSDRRLTQNTYSQPDRPHQEEAEPATDDDDISRLELIQLQEAGGSGGLQDLLQQPLDESTELGAEPTGLRRRTSAALSPLTAARTALGLGLNPSLSASLGVGGGVGGLGGLGLGGLGGLGLGGLGLGGLGLGGLGTVNGLGGFGLSPLTLGLAPITTFPFTGLSTWPLVAPTVISPFMLAQAPFMTLPVPLLGNAGLQVYLAQQQALLSLVTAQGLTLPQQLPLPQTLLPAESLVSNSLSAQAHLAASTKKSLWKQNYLSPLIAHHLQAQKHASGNVQGQLHLSLGANKYASGSLYR